MILHAVLDFVSQYGYIAIYVVLILGIVGIPLPDEVLLTFSGYLVSVGGFEYLPAVLVAFCGSISGMLISFLIGRQFGLPLLQKYGKKIYITRRRLDQAEQWFKRFGKFAVTLGYFIPGVRHITAYSAGISRWPYQTFLVYALPGGLIWVLTFITLGFCLGEHWSEMPLFMHEYMLIILFSFVFLVIAIWVVRCIVANRQ